MTPPPPAATTRRVPVEPTEEMVDAGTGYLNGDQVRRIWAAILAASTPDVAGVGSLPSVEEIANAIRGALVENWNDAVNARRWDEDVLLTGCRKVGGGQGYQKPDDAAQKLALDAAQAILALLARGGR